MSRSREVPELSFKKTILFLISFGLICLLETDGQAISTASVSMLEDLGHAEFYSLIFTVRQVSSLIGSLLCGRMVDKYGRRNVAVFGVAFGLVINFITGFAGNMFVMLMCRMLYGFGIGIAVTTGMIMVGEIAGKKSGYAYSASLLGYCVGSVTGPLITAFMIEHLTWKVTFWVYVIIALIAIEILLHVIPNYTTGESARADIRGMLILIAFICIFVTTLALGGTYISWTNPVTIVMLIAGIGLFAVFLKYEGTIDQKIAIMPALMVRSKLLLGCGIGQFTMGFNSALLLSYISYYMQSEMGTTAYQASVVFSMNYLVTTVVGVILQAAIVKTQKFKFFGMFTVLGESIGLVLIYFLLAPDLNIKILYILMILYGASASVESYIFLMIAQFGSTRSQIAVATAFIRFFSILSGILSTSIGGSIVNSSSSLGSGIKNVYLVCAVTTVIGAALFWKLVPGTEKIKEEAEVAQNLEDFENPEKIICDKG